MNEKIYDEMMMNYFCRRKFQPGMNVRLIRTDQFPQLAGQWGTVSKQQPKAGLIHVEFEEYVGFFPPDNLTEDRELRSDLYLLIRRRIACQWEITNLQEKLDMLDMNIRKLARKNLLCRRCCAVMKHGSIELGSGGSIRILKCTNENCGNFEYVTDPQEYCDEQPGGKEA